MKLIAIFSLLFITSCNKEPEQKASKSNTNQAQVVSLQKTKPQKTPVAAATPDDFSDFKKKEEKCESEEELLKKEFEQKKKSEAGTLKLQGGDSTGCKVE